MSQVTKSVVALQLDLCEPCIQALRKLEKQDKLLDQVTVEPTIVLDAIEEALEVVVKLNEQVAKARVVGPRFYQNMQRAHSLTAVTSALIGQVSAKLKAQLDAKTVH